MHSTPAGTSTSTSLTTNTARPITPGTFQDSTPQSQSREPSTTPATRTMAGRSRSPTHGNRSKRASRCRSRMPEPYGASTSAESNGRPVSRAKTTGSGHHKESSTCTSPNNGDTCTSETLNNPGLMRAQSTPPAPAHGNYSAPAARSPHASTPPPAPHASGKQPPPACSTAPSADGPAKAADTARSSEYP